MNREEFKIGDLVVFESNSISVLKNSIGVVIGTEVNSEYQTEYLSDVDWYVVQFGTMKLIVSNTMVSKLSDGDET
tara:strand:- start:2128 stop:2352 length:225 start_codon:yes stop_codon:yes gene_type:complete